MTDAGDYEGRGASYERYFSRYPRDLAGFLNEYYREKGVELLTRATVVGLRTTGSQVAVRIREHAGRFAGEYSRLSPSGTNKWMGSLYRWSDSRGSCPSKL